MSRDRESRIPRGVLLAALSLAAHGIAAAPDYHRDIQPILARHCLKCHGPDEQRSGLRLDQSADARRGGRSGHPAIVPGNVEAGELLRRIDSANHEERMPRDAEPLSSAERLLLHEWIAAGAAWPDAARHWSLIPPVRPRLPAVRQTDWPRNAVDRFILARLEREGLEPSPETDHFTLLRRLFLELTGVPPEVADADAFTEATSAAAYEEWVDRLLASPRYGERQATPWLDLARYADTNGYAEDAPRSLWPWRDWVIRALNANLPFDRFTIEQLAGDLLPGASAEQIVATGFHRNSLLNDEDGVDAEEFRVAAVLDRVDTTGAVWLGLTLNCAQCHSHKYDPVSQREYYELFAFFNQTTEDGGFPPALELRDPERRLAWQARLQARLAGLEQAGDTGRRHEAVWQELDSLRVSTLIMDERGSRRETQVLKNADFRAPGTAVSFGVPAALHDWPRGAPANRLGLARWLMSPNNPLTARVVMNRLWAQVFGRGLVETVADFGTQGDRPSHPGLLDWLAVEFVENGWNMRHMHRLLVTSATFRQSARWTPLLRERDPANVLLARGPRFRAPAEMVRDIALTISGRLVNVIGGPGVFPPQPPGIWENSYGYFDTSERWIEDQGADRYRRGLYTYLRRTAPHPTGQLFDAPGRNVCAARRERTNNPLQALQALNDVVALEAAAGLARRMLGHAESDIARLTFGFRCGVTRPPRDAELGELNRLLQTARSRFAAEPVAAHRLVGQGRPASQSANAAEFAAWMLVANVLLSLDETITK